VTSDPLLSVLSAIEGKRRRRILEGGRAAEEEMDVDVIGRAVGVGVWGGDGRREGVERSSSCHCWEAFVRAP
jgi:hypothetical protein